MRAKKLTVTILSVCLTIIFIASCEKKSVENWSVALANTLMERYPDPSDYPYRKWCYPQGYMLMGFDKLWQSTGDKKYYDYIMNFAEGMVDSTGVIKRFKGNSMDDMMAGAVIVWAYKQTKDEKFRKAAKQLRDSFNTYPRTTDSIFWHGRKTVGEIWIDGVFMGQMFLTKYGKYIDDSVYCFNEAARQLIGINKHLKKGETGLMLHGWDEDKDVSWANKETGLSSEVWGEGLGWYALVIVETLEIFPKDHPKRAELVKIAQDLMKGLKNNQDPKTGLWYNIVDKGNLPDNWHDASCTGMFLYAIKKSVELELVDAKEYEPVIEKGYKGLLTKIELSPVYGLVNVTSACDGVCVQDNYKIYTDYPKKLNAKEAVAGVLWGTWIVEKPTR